MSVWSEVSAKLEFERVRARVERHAASEPGITVLREQPILTNAGEIRLALARVSEMKRFADEEGDFPLAGIHPVATAVQKAGIDGAVLLGKEIQHVGETLRAARLARAALQKRKEAYVLLWDLAELLTADKILEYNIEQAVDETGAVKANASRELQSIRRSMGEKADQLRRRLESILRNVADLGFSQEEIITTREGRMVIPVKSEHKNRVPGFIHSASSSGATVFVEPTETLELNNEIRNLQFQEQREVDRILRSLTVQIGERKAFLLENIRILALLDAVHARARYSSEVLGIEPVIAEEGPLRIAGARHPVLLINHGYAGTVPLDLDLGGDSRTLVISGPNAGGKSVAMKCVGLICLMAQAGLHVPAVDGTRLRVFRAMFVDIGDEQSIENDLSTFSSHLKNLRHIVDSADAQSLVLIDEIGSGTDPAEGGALAAAVLEALTAKGACTIATTHHSALKVFAHDTDGVENGAMEFDQATLTPTYRFRSGIPGSSYALEMAERLGFPESILHRSREFLGGQQVRLDTLIGELEAAAQRVRAEVESVSRQKASVEEMARAYETRLAGAASEAKELRRKAVEEAAALLERANATIENSVRAIRETGADADTVRAQRREVEVLRKDVASQRASVERVTPEPTAAPVTVGALVTLGGGEDTGEVASIAPDGKTAMVVFGAVKMRVRMNDLRIAARAKRRREQVPDFVEKPDTVSTDLDLRGMTGDEAIPLVDKFLDTALLSGLRRVDLIHGKGTGALRKKVTEFLAHHPRVKSFRLGEWNEGGTGATVVELSDE